MSKIKETDMLKVFDLFIESNGVDATSKLLAKLQKSFQNKGGSPSPDKMLEKATKELERQKKLAIKEVEQFKKQAEKEILQKTKAALKLVNQEEKESKKRAKESKTTKKPSALDALLKKSK